MNSGGSFEVRHSATNAAVFRVDDTGVDLVVGNEDLADGAVTLSKLAPNSVNSSKIVDGSIVDADVSPTANITGGKILAASIGGGPTGQIAANTITSSNIADGTLVDADVSPTAAVAVAKLADVGAGNVLRSNGAGNVAGQVVSGDIADGTIVNADISATAQIAPTKLSGGGTANRVVASLDGTNMTMQQVVDAMVSTAAAIGIAKLADVGAGNVLRSNGAGNVAGQVVSGDIADGTIVNADISSTANITGGKILAASIGSAQIAPGVIASSHILDGAIMDVDVNSAANIDGSKLAVASVPSDRLMSGGGLAAGSVTTSEILDQTIKGTDLNANTLALLAPASLIINGNYTVWQRGTGIQFATPTFGPTSFRADRMFTLPSGGNVGHQINVAVPDTKSRNGIYINGGAGVTTVQHGTRIESMVTNELARGPLVFSCQILNSTGSSFTPTLDLFTPNAVDNFTAQTSRLSQPLQACPNGVWARVFALFDGSTLTNIANGLTVLVTIPSGQLTVGGNAVTFSQFDLRPGTDLVAYQPPSPVATLAACWRYFERWNATGGHAQITQALIAGANDARLAMPFFRKRVSPSISWSAASDLETANVSQSTWFTGGVTLYASGDNTMIGAMTPGSSVGANGQTTFVNWASSTGYIDISAEL